MENIGKSSAEFMARPKLKFFRNKRKFSMIGEGILEELMNRVGEESLSQVISEIGNGWEP